MMDLPLAMLAGPTARQGGASSGTSTSDGDDTSFGAVLSSLLGDAEQEVAEMVETLESLADADAETRDVLTTVGWPLPDLLALAREGDGELGGELLELGGELIEADLPLSEVGSDDLEAAVLQEGAHLLERLAALGEDPEDAELMAALAALHAGSASTEEEHQEGEDEGVETRGARSQGSSSADGGRGVGSEPTLPDAEVEVEGEGESEELRIRRDAGSLRQAVDAEAARDRAIGASRTAAADATARSGAETVRVEGATAVGEPAEAPSPTSPRPTSPTPPPMSLAMQRVMEAVERLELMPPPRQLTIDLGEHRLRVALEDGQLRLTLLDGDQGSGDEFLRDAREELAAQGFDLGEGDDPNAEASPEQDDDPTAAPQASRRSLAASGLRL